MKKLVKLIIPKKILRKVQKKIDLIKQEKISNYWDNVLENYFKNEDKCKIDIKPQKKIENNKIIWQFWAQGWDYDSLPDIVKLCYNSVEKYKDNYTVIRLDENTIFDYLEFPEYIIKKLKAKQISYAHFSDVLRLVLLYKYGGVWLDATVYLSDILPKQYGEYEYFVYQREKNIPDEEKKEYNNLDFYYFSWDKNQKVNMLNSVFFAKQNNDVVKVLLYSLLYFWKENDITKHYYIFQILYDKLMEKYYNQKRCEVISDVLPHKLYFNLLKEYNEEWLKDLFEKISIHKLNFKLQYNEKNIKNTFLEYLYIKEKIESE